MKLHERIRQLMKQHDLTMTALAAESGYSLPAISLWMNDKRGFSNPSLERIAEVFGMNALDLVEGCEVEWGKIINREMIDAIGEKIIACGSIRQACEELGLSYGSINHWRRTGTERGAGLRYELAIMVDLAYDRAHSPIMKVCSDCGQNLPVEDFYQSVSGFPRQPCKKCTHKRQYQYQKAKRAQGRISDVEGVHVG